MIEAVAAACGITPRGRRWGPCLACGADALSDGRAPVRIHGEWWTCYACHEWGGALDWASYRATGQPGNLREARRWLAEAHIVADPAPLTPQREQMPASRPPVEQVRALIQSGVPVSRTTDRHVLAWLEERQIGRNVPARVITQGPDWWPWSASYPLIVGAYTGDGRLVSVHGRRIHGDGPKTRWPRGFDARSLLLADRQGVESLRGRALKRLVICEGLSDTLWTSSRADADTGVLGYESGSRDALRLAKIQPATSVIVATDPDPAGDAYAEQIARELHPRPLRRVPLHRLD